MINAPGHCLATTLQTWFLFPSRALLAQLNMDDRPLITSPFLMGVNGNASGKPLTT